MPKISDYDAASSALTTHEFFAIDPAQTGAAKNQRVDGAKVASLVLGQTPPGATKMKEFLFSELILAAGTIAVITDSDTATVGDEIGGGGTKYVLGFCNGNKWVVVVDCTTLDLPDLPTPDTVTTGTATGGIWPGTGTITDNNSDVWSIGYDRVVAKNGTPQAFSDVMELWYADNSVFAFDGLGWSVISGTSTADRPKMPTTPGLRMAVGVKPLTLPAGVTINPGDSIQAVVDANPAGTTYCLTKGTYSGQSVTPKAGDRFFGEHDGTDGVILDGTASQQFCFYVALGVDRVVIQNFTVINYAAPVQYCALQVIGEHCLVQDCDVSAGTAGGGILMSGHGIMVGCRSHHNFQIGHKVVGDDVTGVVTVHGCLIDSNEFDHNNVADSILGGAEQGGGKAWDTQGLTYWYNYSHDNGGSGLWTDFDNINTRYWYNQIDNNTNDGIEHEIGWNASIIGNSITGNGSTQAAGYYFSACGIGIENSGGVNSGTWAGWIEIADNVITAGEHGRLLGLRDQARGTSSLAAYSADRWAVKNVYVHNNTFDASIGLNDTMVGMVRDHDYTPSNPGYISAADFFAQANVVFDHNDYTMAAATSFWAWQDNGFLNFTQWQAVGQDLNGTYQLAPDIDPSATPIWSSKNKEADITISNGGLTATSVPTFDKNMVGRGTTEKTIIQAGDKRYMEFTLGGAAPAGIGVSNVADTYNFNWLGSSVNSLGHYADGSIWFNGNATLTAMAFIAGYTLSDRLNMAVHGGNKVWFGVNGVWDGDPAAGTGGFDISSMGDVFPAYGMRSGAGGSTNSAITANFGATAFTDTPPTGFTALP